MCAAGTHVTIALGHLSEARALALDWVLSGDAVGRLTVAHGGDVPAAMSSRAGGDGTVLAKSAMA